MLAHGLLNFFAPAMMMVKIIGGNPVDLCSLRWFGGILIALGISTLMVYSKPEKQGIFVLTTALAHLLAGLGILYSLIMHEYIGATSWLLVMTDCIILILAVLLFWGRSKAKGIL
jgi:tryptophan-rich sensory protein